MRRDGFFLGMVATGSQVLMLRELISALQGDELFVGTALCGWLLWGALGAYLEGRRKDFTSPSRLFILAALLLPLTVILGRLSPLLVTTAVGEAVPFSYAALLSFLVMLPPAFVCGRLYAKLVRRAGNDATAQIEVYFSEGVGAFAGCLAVSLATIGGVSTWSAAAGLCFIVWAALPLMARISTVRRVITVAAGIGVAVGAALIGPQVDRSIERFKYRPYEVVVSSENPYGRETLLTRGGARVVLSDNVVESVEGDIQTAEDLLLPPLAYEPEATAVLIFGRLDLSIGPLLVGLPNLKITEVDARPPLREAGRSTDSSDRLIRYVQDDPIAYLRSRSHAAFDVVIFPLGESGSLRGLRLMTAQGMADVRRVLRPRGVLYVVTPYDSERYVTSEDELLLSTIRRTLETVFPRVIVWPGSSTLFLAGDSSLSPVSPADIAARIGRLGYQAEFLSSGYVLDRLSAERVERIDRATARVCPENSLERPVLANLQILQRSRSHRVDRWVGGLMTADWVWEAVLVVVIVGLAISVAAVRRRGAMWRGLYVAAGFISLVLELVSFYVYQSSAGMLYSHLSLLVGSFMLGLAVGARLASSFRSVRFAPAVLTVLTGAIIVFWVMALRLPPGLVLWFHAGFQFVVAFCTGAMFVAATAQYYGEGASNAGTGYALELMGSSMAALITTPFLLPALGLRQLLAAVAVLAGLLFLRALRGWGHPRSFSPGA